MTQTEQKKAAKEFAEYWKNKGYEKGQSQPFWIALLGDVLGMEHPTQGIEFEDQVKMEHTSFIVYNNFPWPNPTPDQKAKIEKTAQAILDSRAKYPNASLADLYDEATMPPELRKAHQENDKAVMTAYGFRENEHWLSEPETVAWLMQMYVDLTAVDND